MQISYIYMRPVEVLYVRALGPYKASASEAWGTMLVWLEERGLRERIARGFGIANDPPGTTAASAWRYDACVEVPDDVDEDVIAGLGRQTVQGGAYVVHRHVGRHRLIGAGFSYLHRKWVPGHGLMVDRRRPYLEIYLNDPGRTAPRDLQTDLCVPVYPVVELAEQNVHRSRDAMART